jgi:hypothetical protein
MHLNVVIASIPIVKVAAEARQRRCLWTLFPQIGILVNTARQFKDIPQRSQVNLQFNVPYLPFHLPYAGILCR